MKGYWYFLVSMEREKIHTYPVIPNYKNRRLYSKNLGRGVNHSPLVVVLQKIPSPDKG